MKGSSRCILLLFLLGASLTQAKTINVPADQPTIQAAITAAGSGDIVMVAAGTYQENINFLGKMIQVKSVDGPATTIIDGGRTAPVAVFVTGEGPNSRLIGFTLQNGIASADNNRDGGGIYINAASPTIQNNILKNNTACDGGAGMAVRQSSARIQGNTFINNDQGGCTGGIGGGGIAVFGQGSTQIVHNLVSGNNWSGNGAGIALVGAGTPTVMNNNIRGNIATGLGGGIYLANGSGEKIVQNIIQTNSATQGAGIYMSAGANGQMVLVNTVASNSGSPVGSALYFVGSAATVQMFDNIFQGEDGSNALFCDQTHGNPPTLVGNDAYSLNGTGMTGDCTPQADKRFNISASPQFVKPGNYKLDSSSPVIDAGINRVPGLPKTDFGGNPRIRDGNGDGFKIIDMGAYEFQVN